MIIEVNRLSFFTKTIFTKKSLVRNSLYIRAMHPKAEIRPEASAIERILSLCWVGQLKVHGHRAQIHVPADPDKKIVAYTRQGTKHKKEISPAMEKEIYRLFRPKKDWNVLDAEWVKEKDRLFVFDILKKEGQILRKMKYLDRWAMLPRDFISAHVTVLPLLKDLDSCMKALRSNKPHIEGLVFKSCTSTGFSDTSIIRCRKRPELT